MTCPPGLRAPPLRPFHSATSLILTPRFVAPPPPSPPIPNAPSQPHPAPGPGPVSWPRPVRTPTGPFKPASLPARGVRALMVDRGEGSMARHSPAVGHMLPAGRWASSDMLGLLRASYGSYAYTGHDRCIHRMGATLTRHDRCIHSHLRRHRRRHNRARGF